MWYLPNQNEKLVIEIKTNKIKKIGYCALFSTAIILSACASKETKIPKPSPSPKKSDLVSLDLDSEVANINHETKFTSKEFGVKGSPRITTAKSVRKGGGRYQIGKPYTIRGKRYYPKEDKNLKQVGMASWYGPNFHGRLTANGEVYDQYSLSAAHPTMPLPSYAKVTNVENGRTVTVRVNDRGPYSNGRVIDLSAQAAKMLDYTHKGVTKVKVEYIGKARMDGLDHEVLLASYKGPALKQMSPNVVDQPIIKQQTLVAMSPKVQLPNQPIAQSKSILTPSVGVGDSASVSAINRSFSQTNAIPISTLPIPVKRPTVFESVSDGGDVTYQTIRKPLAYFADNNAVNYSDFYTERRNDYVSISQFSNLSIHVNLGTLKAESDKIVLIQLFAGAGEVIFDGLHAKIAVPEKNANIVFDYASQIGLLGVAIR